jgi:hypothetical protein
MIKGRRSGGAPPAFSVIWIAYWQQPVPEAQHSAPGAQQLPPSQHGEPGKQQSAPSEQQFAATASCEQQAAPATQQSSPWAQQSPVRQHSCGGLQQSAPGAQQDDDEALNRLPVVNRASGSTNAKNVLANMESLLV